MLAVGEPAGPRYGEATARAAGSSHRRKAVRGTAATRRGGRGEPLPTRMRPVGPTPTRAAVGANGTGQCLHACPGAAANSLRLLRVSPLAIHRSRSERILQGKYQRRRTNRVGGENRGASRMMVGSVVREMSGDH